MAKVSSYLNVLSGSSLSTNFFSENNSVWLGGQAGALKSSESGTLHCRPGYPFFLGGGGWGGLLP